MSTLEVHIVTPQEEVWSGAAEMVIAKGIDGVVGILEGHIPLLIQLASGNLRILRDSEPEMVADVDGGFLHVSSGADGTRVDVMATKAEMAGLTGTAA